MWHRTLSSMSRVTYWEGRRKLQFWVCRIFHAIQLLWEWGIFKARLWKCRLKMVKRSFEFARTAALWLVLRSDIYTENFQRSFPQTKFHAIFASVDTGWQPASTRDRRHPDQQSRHVDAVSRACRVPGAADRATVSLDIQPANLVVTSRSARSQSPAGVPSTSAGRQENTRRPITSPSRERRRDAATCKDCIETASTSLGRLMCR